MIDVIDDIIRREGSEFTNDPDDGGGPTRWGITGETFCEDRRDIGEYVPQTDEEIIEAIQALTEVDARAIYVRRYVLKPRFGEIKHPELRALLIDAGVLHGRHRAARWLQESVGGLKTDGLVGPVTLAAVNGRQWREIYKKLLARRYRGFVYFVKRKPSQLKWLGGWTNRANEFLLRL